MILSTLVTILAFIIVLGVLVLVHEFGHFIAAKKLGVKVEEFAFGFPPRIYSLKRGETEYSINALPFGGYVKMLGELEHSKSPRAFENQKPWKRFLISIAGVIMNFILAWVILTIGFTAGMSPLATPASEIPGKIISSAIVVADVAKGSAAEGAGIKQGDILLRGVANGAEVDFKTVTDVSSFTKSHKGENVELVYKQEDKEISKTISLSPTSDAPLGIALGEDAIIKVPWYKAPYVSLRETWLVTTAIFDVLKGLVVNIFKHAQVSEGVGGPVAIYMYSGLAFRAGWLVFLRFIATLSINLGLINILPFPALDGGRLLFIILEKIRGKKVVREDVENLIHTIGFALLIVLLIAITYRDIVNYFFKR